MKAKLKINYSEAVKGQIFNILEIKNKRITIDINGRKVDFGTSEIQIVADTIMDINNLGRELLLIGNTSLQGWKEIDVTNFIYQFNLPINKSLMRRAINTVIWG